MLIKNESITASRFIYYKLAWVLRINHICQICKRNTEDWVRVRVRESRCKKEEKKKRKRKKEQVQKRKMKETQPQFLLQYFFLTNKNKNIYVKSSTCAGSWNTCAKQAPEYCTVYTDATFFGKMFCVSHTLFGRNVAVTDYTVSSRLWCVSCADLTHNTAALCQCLAMI